MFIVAVIIIFLISFILALWSLKSINDKPKVGHVKKSLDKHRVIYHSSE